MGKKSKGQGRGGPETSGTSMVVYRGPISRPNQGASSVRVALKGLYPINSASAGYIETFLNTATVPNLSEYGSFAATWREYRVLGIRYEYWPSYDSSGYNGSARTLSTGAMVAYHGPVPAWQGAVTSSSTTNTWLMEGAKPWHPSSHLVVEWRMSDIEEAQFFSTSSSFNSGGIYGVVPNASGNVPYGTCFATFLVEFKGRV